MSFSTGRALSWVAVQAACLSLGSIAGSETPTLSCPEGALTYYAKHADGAGVRCVTPTTDGAGAVVYGAGYRAGAPYQFISAGRVVGKVYAGMYSKRPDFRNPSPGPRLRLVSTVPDATAPFVGSVSTTGAVSEVWERIDQLTPEDKQSKMMDLQQQVATIQQTLQTLSNISKSQHQTAMAIIGNLR